MRVNRLAAGALPRTPLRELSAPLTPLAGGAGANLLCGGPRRPAVSSLDINEHTRRACDAPVNSR